MVVTLQTQADWQATTYSLNIDTTTVPNHLKADFASTAARVDSGWVAAGQLPNWSVDSRTNVTMGGVGTAYLQMNSNSGIVPLQTWRSNVTGSGRWDVTVSMNASAAMWSFIFMAQNVNPSTLVPMGSFPGNTTNDYYALYQGYCLRVDSTQNFPNPFRVALQRLDGNAVLSTNIASTTIANGGVVDMTFTIVRYPTGLIKVFLNGSGSPLLTATDTTYTTGNFLGFASYQNAFVAKNTASGAGLWKPSTSMQTFWFSASVDTSVNPEYWRNRLYLYNANGPTPLQLGDFGLQMVTKADTTVTTGTVVFPDFIRPNQSPSSSPLQYMRLGINFPAINLASNQDPDITKIVIGFPLKNKAFLA